MQMLWSKQANYCNCMLNVQSAFKGPWFSITVCIVCLCIRKLLYSVASQLLLYSMLCIQESTGAQKLERLWIFL